MKKKIPSGYQIQITSWENDGDNYNTQILEGLTKDCAKALVEFAKIFKISCYDKGGIAANACSDDEVKWPILFKKVRGILSKYPGSIEAHFEESGSFSKYTDEELRDLISELNGEILGQSEYLFRVFSGYEAYYYPEDIEINSVDLFKD